jgi:hypothetical protein
MADAPKEALTITITPDDIRITDQGGVEIANARLADSVKKNLAASPGGNAARADVNSGTVCVTNAISCGALSAAQSTKSSA